MEILYPYNEALPKKTAHDVYLFRNCASLAEQGMPVTLACGWRSQTDTALFHHYGVVEHCGLRLKRLPLIRHWGPISCNTPFFWAAQRMVARQRPHWLLSSVFKQADYHTRRRIAGVKYAYEVHQLSWYPTCDTPERRLAAERERDILNQMDLVTTTTAALKAILQKAPYALSVPIEIVPLAVENTPLAPPGPANPFVLMYIGQLYASQGVDLLLRAVAAVPNIVLEIVGGQRPEIRLLSELATSLGIMNRVKFHGFLSPVDLPAQAQRAHAFVAPFYATERMPYVAHTKLLEYAAWGRPIVAPRVEAVLEVVSRDEDDCLFEPGDVHALEAALVRVQRQVQKPVTQVLSWRDRAAVYRKALEQYGR